MKLFIAVILLIESNAFLATNKFHRGISGSRKNSHSNDGYQPPPAPPPPNPLWLPERCDEDNPVTVGLWHNETLELRGGTDNIVKGAQATLSSSTSFWSRTFSSFTRTVTKPISSAGKSLSRVFRSKKKKEEDKLMEQLQTMTIKQVVVPNSSVLPRHVVELAAKRSGVLGNPLRHDRVQDFAQNLKRWYTRKGYILHSVTGATLKPETATAEITVQEPVASGNPVGITFYKEMVVDDETGELVTFRQYKEKHATRRTIGFDKIDKKDLNTTLVPTQGRTSAQKIASALSLRPGEPFQWDGSRWQRVLSSGIFANVVRASPQPMRDGTVQLQILAVESPSRHLEYGVGRSLYTGSWEGELQFEHGNLLGGAESLGVKVRRGAKDALPSIQLSFSDSRFGSGGYDVEVFSDFLGNQKDAAMEGEEPKEGYEHDALRDRRGATIRVRNPFSRRIIRNSLTSASVERTATKTGLYEDVGSTTINVGPIVRELPLAARSNFDLRLTAGTRITSRLEAESANGDSEEAAGYEILSGKSLLPFVTATGTTRQVFPLSTGRRPTSLALQHSLTTSSRDVPRHQALAQGSGSNIRGNALNGRVSSSIQGTTELRVPVDIPLLKQLQQDASVVVFGDWLLAKQDTSSGFYRKSCIGVGIRKSVQGLPLKFDLTYSKDSKVKTSFGLGRDFDV
jgi:outer membrane protein assembly factor BamA